MKLNHYNQLTAQSVFKEKLILASNSPRRAAVLTAVGWPFDVNVAGVDETPAESEDADTYVKRLALSKAEAVARGLSSGLVLGADTVVVIDGEILGKPLDKKDAARMLRLLSGKWHGVLTGVALIRPGTRMGEPPESLVDVEVTRVRFAALSEAEIDWYVSTDEPLDKAGAYAIQGRAAVFIEEIQGDYFNIVGLPVRLVYKLARKI
jgi:nucleoside triphosphate pyrophosphatase